MAFGWFYFVQPVRHLGIEEWRAQHTDQEVWDEFQRKVRRLGWGHEGSVEVDRWCGDSKDLTRWIVDHIRAEDDLAGCQAGHKDEALETMTNQSVGKKGKDLLEWWEKNRDKSQEEWIRDGFAARNLVLHKPLDKSDVLRLLTVMGQDDSPPGHRHNAFRLIMASNKLRELDFKQVHDEAMRDVFNGLRNYGIRCSVVGHAIDTARQGIGEAPMEQNVVSIAQPRVATIAYGVMSGVGAVGGILLFVHFVRSTRSRAS